jgi:hypothetical protein
VERHKMRRSHTTSTRLVPLHNKGRGPGNIGFAIVPLPPRLALFLRKQGGAVVALWRNKPGVAGSIPAPANRRAGNHMLNPGGIPPFSGLQHAPVRALPALYNHRQAVKLVRIIFYICRFFPCVGTCCIDCIGGLRRVFGAAGCSCPSANRGNWYTSATCRIAVSSGTRNSHLLPRSVFIHLKYSGRERRGSHGFKQFCLQKTLLDLHRSMTAVSGILGGGGYAF